MGLLLMEEDTSRIHWCLLLIEGEASRIQGFVTHRGGDQ